MANKVVICGIDTSTLPKCTNSKLVELMQKIKSGNPEAREVPTDNPISFAMFLCDNFFSEFMMQSKTSN